MRPSFSPRQGDTTIFALDISRRLKEIGSGEAQPEAATAVLLIAKFFG